MENTQQETRKENNRIFNLVWVFLFTVLILRSFLYPTDESFYFVLSLIFLAVGILDTLFVIVPKRNNFVSAFFLLITASVFNFVSCRFYDLTWLFSPSLDNIVADPGKLIRWFSFCSWCISFLAVLIFIYMFLSSFSRVFFKKANCFICALISFVLVGISSVVCFYIFSETLLLTNANVSENIDSSVNIEILDSKDIQTANILTEMESSETFWVYAEGLSKGKKYGLRILDEEENMLKEESDFQYCRNDNCSLYFGPLNTVYDRWDPGKYTIQILSQDGNTLKVINKEDIEIGELEISEYSSEDKYPCTMWLEMGDSGEKLLRIDADSQEITNIAVMAQCDEGQTYEGQVAVGTISQEVQYYTITITTGDPVQIMGLGGNTSHGYVRLIIDNQTMGEVIVNRGFPICDNGKIVEGGQQSDCE